MANLSISDIRMLELIEILKETSIIRFEADFARAIEMHKQSIPKVRTGAKSFTGVQISRACVFFNINANYIMGMEKNVFRGEANSKGLDRLITNIRRLAKAKEMPLPG